MNRIYKIIPWIYSRTSFLASLKETGTLLDVGCGPGEFKELLNLIKPKWDFHGTDISKHDGLYQKTYFFESDITKKINCPDNMYDAIVCTHVCEHLTDPHIAIKEIYRVLKPEGILYIETPSHRSVFCPSFTSIHPENLIPINFYDDNTHIRPYTVQALIKLTKNCGFKIQRYGYARNLLATITSPITFLIAIIFKKRSFLVHSVWHSIGWSNFLIAQK